MIKHRHTNKLDTSEVNQWDVLIIDDNQIDAFVCQRLLETANIVDTTNWLPSAKEGLDYIGQPDNRSPKLIFLDLQMPIKDGFYFLEQYNKKYAGQSETPLIIVLTSYINDQITAKINAYPFVFRVIEKPLDINVISDLWKEISTAALTIA